MENSYENLIRRYCDGGLSEGEDAILLDWVRSSEENRQLFRQIEQDWQNSHRCELSARVAVAKAFDRAKKAKAHSRMAYAISGIAASIILAFGLLVFNNGKIDIREMRADAQASCVKVPMASTTEIILPDGTKVCLNAGSTLSYDRKFNKNNRNIHLSGEAYFDVAHNENLPFVVHTTDCDITALGTRFDVYAYEGEGVTYAALLEGSLRFNAGTSTVLISPDEVATFDGMSIIKSMAETDQYISWINGEIKYDEINLSEFLNRLSRLYDVSITYGKSNLDSRKFRAAFTQKESLDNIMSAITSLLPIKAEKNGEGYIVTEN